MRLRMEIGGGGGGERSLVEGGLVERRLAGCLPIGIVHGLIEGRLHGVREHIGPPGRKKSIEQWREALVTRGNLHLKFPLVLRLELIRPVV